MDFEKLVQVVAYVLKKYDGKLNYTKLIKLLYLADREALRETSVSITGSTYFSMDSGPVLSELYDFIRQNGNQRSQRIWNRFFTIENEDQYNLILTTPDIPEGKLSDYDKEILDRIINKFFDFTYGQLIDYVHSNCPEWEDPRGTSTPIYPYKILKALGKTDDEINFILEEERSYNREESILRNLANA